MTKKTGIILDNGKYHFYRGTPPYEYELYCNRYNEPWRNFSGDKAINELYNYAYKLERIIEEALDTDGTPSIHRILSNY